MTSQNTRLPSYIYISQEQAKRYADHTAKGVFALGRGEQFWRDRQPYLENCGYLLRPRYIPDWSPSWIDTLLDPLFCEDSIVLIHHNVIDATRLEDGSTVSIKTTSKNSDEIAIATFLSSEELMRDPTNHCVPLFEVFDDPQDHTLSFMVMPYLRPFDDPEFGAIGEVVDFVRQTLEGLCFLHGNRIAHRDCAAANIMMDGRPLYPNGHHPMRRSYAMDAVHELTPLSRIDHPVRYYFIDFGISTRFEEGASSYVLGRKGRDKELPELSSDVPYDAFKADLFILGNLYKKEFVNKYHGVEFLQPLINAMTAQVPAQRPTAEDALAQFEHIRASLNAILLRWRLRSRTESPPERVLYDTVAAAREGIYHLKRLVT